MTDETHSDEAFPYPHTGAPGWDALVAVYRSRTSAPKHLASLALRALDEAGFDVVARDPEKRGT